VYKPSYLFGNCCDITKTDRKHTSYTSTLKLTTTKNMTLAGDKMEVKDMILEVPNILLPGFRYLKVKATQN